MDAPIASLAEASVQSADVQSIASVLHDRARYLRMIGSLYYKPLTEGDIDRLDADAFAKLSHQCEDELEREGYNDMYRFLRRRDTGTRQVLNVDFTSAFYGANTYEGLTAEPYESLYTSPEGRLMGPARTEVMRSYRRWGMRLEDGIDLPEDHLSFECEFLAHLNDVAAEALEVGDRDSCLEALAAQRAFLEGHVLKWFPRFFNLSNKLLKTRFYRGVNKVSKAFFAAEPQALDELVEVVSGR